MLLLLVACVRLQEGDYAVDYDPVSVDSCDLYQDGQALADTTGELSWEGPTLVFEFDGTDDDLAFDVAGKRFSRESEGTIYMGDDDNCSLLTEQTDEGEMVSATDFEGHTRIVGILQGDCALWEAILDDPCEVEFEWDGDYLE